MTVAQRKWIKVLHVAKRECGLDDEAYRALLSGAAGVESAKEIKTWEQYNKALLAFKNLGFRVNSTTSRASGLKEVDAGYRNPQWLTRRQEYYIRGLWDLASRKKDVKSLRAMLMRIAKVSAIRFCKRADATKVILAFRDIAGKAGYDPDGPDKD
jgi:NAD-dependent DNA ligase